MQSLKFCDEMSYSRPRHKTDEDRTDLLVLDAARKLHATAIDGQRLVCP